MIGPVDYVVVGFKGNSFDGSIMNSISEAVDKQIIRVLDLLFVMKDKDGTVLEAEYEDQSEDLQKTFGKFNYDKDTPLLTESDVAKIGEQMEPDTAAGVLVIEQSWAKGLKESLLKAGGFLMAEGRIHPEKVESALKELGTTDKK